MVSWRCPRSAPQPSELTLIFIFISATATSLSHPLLLVPPWWEGLRVLGRVIATSTTAPLTLTLTLLQVQPGLQVMSGC